MVTLSASDPSATNQTSIPSLVSSGFAQFLLLFTMNMSVSFSFSPLVSYDLSAILSLKCTSTVPQNSFQVYSIVTITYTLNSGCGGSLVGSGLLPFPFDVELKVVLSTENAPSLPSFISFLTTSTPLPFEMPLVSEPFTPTTNLDSVIKLPHSNFVIDNSHFSSLNSLRPQICSFK